MNPDTLLPKEPAMYKLDEVADLLNLTKEAVRRAIKRGDLLAFKQNGRWYVPRRCIIDYLWKGRSF